MPAGPLDASLIGGVIPWTVWVLGGVALLLLVFRARWRGPRGRRWWTRVLPLLVLAAAAVTGLLAWIVDELWRPFPDPVPRTVLVWIGVLLAAVGLGVAAGRASWRWAVPAVVLVAALSGIQVNAFYGYYPTPRGLFGLPATGMIDFADVPDAPAGGPVSSGPWTPPPDLPRNGAVAQVSIPGAASGFAARPGWVYLPPAALSTRQRPMLPVLVLVSGQPGKPEDWLVAGRLAAVMDHYAADNHGLAPIVVVPDATGTALANPLCMDSRLGAVETYLTRDVPDWVAQHLTVDPDHRHWAIGGFSYGGTCALQLAVRAPQVYPSFIDVSGQSEPTLGDHARTVAATFGGDEAAFAAVNPLDVLRTRTFPDSAGFLAVGRDDRDYGPAAATVLAATRDAGMAVQLMTVPGAHAWPVATTALAAALPWLAERTGLAAVRAG